MGLGKPDVKREYTGLGAEAKQQTGCPDKKVPVADRPALPCQRMAAHRLRQRRDFQCSQLPVKDKQPHQHYQPADYRHSQIGFRSPQRFLRLLMRHPGIRGEGHNFKEYKSRI